MTDSKGNSEFCFLETLHVWGRGETKPTVSRGTSHEVFCYTFQLKTRKNCEEMICFTPSGSQICPGFKEHDLITCESKVHVVSLGS